MPCSLLQSKNNKPSPKATSYNNLAFYDIKAPINNDEQEYTMPSFDIISEVDTVELKNAVDN
ncbi:MAG: hypothetical protein WCF45_11785, partial [Photobacterium halotolerans]